MEQTIIDLEKQHVGIIQSPILENIRKHFSVENKAAKFKWGNQRFIPKRKYAITPLGRFDVGLLRFIYNYASKFHNVVVTDKFNNVFKPSYDLKTISELKIPLRDYQKENILKCFNHGRGISVIATAGGKTLIMATLIHNVMQKNFTNNALVITPSVQLVQQTYNDFIDYGIPESNISKWTGKDKLDSQKPIVIAGLNILLEENTNLSSLPEFNLVLFDECHCLRRGNELNKLFKHINTSHCFGFTGTMPEELLDRWNVIGKIGPILYEKTSQELRKEKYIADVKAQIIYLKHKTKPIYSSKNIKTPTLRYKEEYNFLYNNKFRNEIFKILCSKLTKNALLLIDRIEHGELLFNLLSTISDKQVYFIKGEVNIDEREKIRNLMEINNNIICIAISKIFSTGINIKNLHYVIFALVGKAKVKLIQSIGRGLRLHENKHELIIFDIADNVEYSYKHLKKRLLLYEKERILYQIQKITEL